MRFLRPLAFCIGLLAGAVCGSEAPTANGAPEWAKAVPVRQWYALAGTEYRAAIKALAPEKGYIGYDPIGGTVDSYDDPVANADNSAVYFYGGGHGSSTLNGVFKFDTINLKYSIAIAPTPPDKYPPAYVKAEGNDLTYPSGAKPGHFSADLTDPADLPFKAPQNAPTASHMYSACDMRGDVIHYFYGAYRCANVKTGKWESVGEIDVGAQVGKLTADKKYGTAYLQQGTAAVYDDVTDRFLVSLVPGDAGINWRGNRLFFWDPVKQVIEPKGPADGMVPICTRSSMNLFKGGRWAYMLMCNAPTTVAPDTVNGAFRYNFDTGKIETLRIEGDLFKFAPDNTQETVPCVYHAGRNSLIRWEYLSDVNALYEVNLTPVSGAGTDASPYVLHQTRIPLTGALSVKPLLNYRRMFYNAKTGVMMFMPNSNSTWYAVKL